MSNLSQAGARDRGHQVGCPKMHEAEATCTCNPDEAHPDQRHQDHWPLFANDLYIGGFDGEEGPWWIWVIAFGALALAVLFLFWITGVI